MRRLFLLLCLGTLLTVTLAGCGGDSNIKDAPYENVPLEDIEGNDLAGASMDQLYHAGHEYLVAGSAKEAIPIYNAIRARFPFSHAATQAAMETVTAYYVQKKYAEAVSAADRFIKQHPRHQHIDYLYYLRGLSNFHRNDPGIMGGDPDQRDLSYLKQAFSDFKLLIDNYPNSVYAKDSQLHMIQIQDRLAKFELSVSDFYLQRHAYVAAARRASYIVRHYQRSSSTPRALEIMQESYIQLGLPALASDARSILQASYPGYILHRDRYYRERADEYYGNDGLPGTHRDELVEHPVGPIRSFLKAFVPWRSADDEGAWHEWLEGVPTEIMGTKAAKEAAQKKAEKKAKEKDEDNNDQNTKASEHPSTDEGTNDNGNNEQSGSGQQEQQDNAKPGKGYSSHPDRKNSNDGSKWLKGKSTKTM